MSKDTIALNLRLPADMHARLREEAKRFHRSLNTHIIELLDEVHCHHETFADPEQRQKFFREMGWLSPESDSDALREDIRQELQQSLDRHRADIERKYQNAADSWMQTLNELQARIAELEAKS